MPKYSRTSRNDSLGQPQRRINIPTDVLAILSKDTVTQPRFVEKSSPSDKIRCRLCDEPRTQRALDENGICRSAKACNEYRRLGDRIDGQPV